MKKCVCFILVVCLLSVVSAQESTFDSLLESDVNMDGVVNRLDLTYVASYIGEMANDELSPSPDINKDNVVNILDLVLIASHFGKYSGIPLELSDESFDSTIRDIELPVLVEFKSDY